MPTTSNLHISIFAELAFNNTAFCTLETRMSVFTGRKRTLHWTKILLSCPTLRLLADRFYYAFLKNWVIFPTRVTWTSRSWRRHTYTPVDGGRGEMTLRCVSSFHTDWRCGGLFFRLRHKLRWVLVWFIWSVSNLIVLIWVRLGPAWLTFLSFFGVKVWNTRPVAYSGDEIHLGGYPHLR